ncbi:transposase [Nitrosomonas sp. Nm34]|uniref:transposase n=1 Tax=Nitrosomonas sp. Nm34 TaxID=1881055 RepID=UPI0008EDEC51|nr:transposase [Nitrosomonas sp. Nm34]SFJ08240.1 REP element-mobilizing transposase RayT [Nitrosomonas sp. Nm34]
MARPLRIEFAGALYHVTARGNAREDIYHDDIDRQQFLLLLQNTVNRYDWYCHAYCLMDNHYHLLIETNSPTLSKGMKYLNGTYTQYFNRQHRRVGHVFQGRFKAILVQKDAYLLELARYIALNPVRAQMVRSAKAWRWSSYRATAGYEKNDACLTTEWILARFDKTKRVAQQRYRDFVRAGKEQPSPWQRLKNQIYLGDDDFVNDMQRKLNTEQSLTDIPRKQTQAPIKPLSYFADRYKSRDEGMVQAYLSGHYTLAQVGEYFGVSYATVSRAVKQAEKSKR